MTCASPRARRCLAVGLLLAAVLAAASAVGAQELSVTARGLQPSVVLTAPSPLSSSWQILHRLLTPLALAQLQEDLARSHKRLQAQSVDLKEERFAVYVPPGAAPRITEHC